MKIKPIRILIIRVTLITLIGVAAIVLWYFNRPLPEPTTRDLFQGISYTRMVRTQPVHQVIHVTQIDLTADGIHLFVTPGDQTQEYDYLAQTTSQFLEKYGVQLAINGDFFRPYHNNGPFDFYPHVGDGINVGALSISEGDIVSLGYNYNNFWANDVTIYFTEDNQVAFEEPEGQPYNAISGHRAILESGVLNSTRSQYHLTHQPRTALGVSEDGNTLILVVIDGRQPNYSEGATWQELADILLEFGAYHALNLDGGGSSTMVYERDGTATQLNSPIQHRIPGIERPVANHLGVYAKPLP